MKQPIGITFVVPSDQDAIGVYDSPSGVDCFETDAPYLLEDGASLVSPLPAIRVDGSVYLDSLGNAQSALAVNFGDSPVVPDGAVVNNGIPVTHEGVQVVHTG